MPPKNFLKSFLTSSRAALAASQKSHTPPTIVLGNESADLDSLASSILFAYLTPTRPRPIPLLSIPRADLSLRPEFTHLLSTLSLAPTDLLCLDDAPSLPKTTRVHLVDHNRTSYLNVLSIIDHHTDEGHHLHASPRIIEPAGSCVSLVINHLLPPSLSDVEERTQVATLAMAAVLIDTSCLTQKVTPHDTTAVATLRYLLPDTFDPSSFFTEFWSAKTRVEGMGTRDLLRKDYKEWVEPNGKKVGISSVVKGLSYLREKEPGFLETVRGWGMERELDVVAVMTAEGKGEGFRRELLVWAVQDGVKDAVAAFADTERERLGLETWGRGEMDGESRWVWKQRRLEMSRKQVAPLLREYVRKGRADTPTAKV